MDVFSGPGKALPMSVLVSESEAPASEVPDPWDERFEQFNIGGSLASETWFTPAYSPQLALQGLQALGCLGLTALARAHLRASQALADEGLDIARMHRWLR